MKVFLTGANGFIGSRLVDELIGAGHQVVGLTRSLGGAKRLEAAGAVAHRGDIEDIARLQRGADDCDGVIHTAFDHDFSNYVANCKKDERAIKALGAALSGSDRPLVVTSTTLFGERTPGSIADEDVFNDVHGNPRVISERAIRDLAEKGVNVSAVRLAQIHDRCRQGLITFLVALARESGCSAYIAGTDNKWCAAHLDDTVRLYRHALDRAVAGGRYHAVAEEGVMLQSIAEALGQTLGLPVCALDEQQAAAHFGWLNAFVAKNMMASSDKTQERLNWKPLKSGLLDDLAHLTPGT